MSEQLTNLGERIRQKLGEAVTGATVVQGELTLQVAREAVTRVATSLRDDFGFEQLMDLCGVDYQDYRKEAGETWDRERFAVVYHLLSIKDNRRLRMRVLVGEELPMLDSVINVWNSANWYEREAYDLFGIMFEGHPDLRRILTDYGFIGHPFRKDFPISGYVEMRYDETRGRVVYEPVSITPRINVPRVIREEGYGE